MSYTLLELSSAQLDLLSRDLLPPEFESAALPEAMPPAFIARLSLRLAAQGVPAPWCSTFLIRRKRDGRLVGACGFKAAPDEGRVEVGYGVAPEARGEGAATAALRALAALAFEAGASEVLAEVEPANLASLAVVRKAGFEQIGRRVDESGDEVEQWVLSVAH